MIYAIGETVYDIIFRDGTPVAARPGGSKLNSAVSLGRCGLDVEMITEIGDDTIGRLVINFLKDNGISTSFIHPAKGCKTPVSLAFLDENGNASYTFYKQYPARRLEVEWPVAGKGDIVLFGSFYCLDPAVRLKLIPFLQQAKDNGAFIVYDPNIRKNHLAEVRKMIRQVVENIALSGIVRGSDEDFLNLFGTHDTEKIFKKISSSGCNHLIITKGSDGAEFMSAGCHFSMPSVKISVVSTIGAGDAFNAGIIFGIVKKGINVDYLVNITEEDWTGILDYGINFAANVCSGYDNYVSEGFVK